MTTRRERLEAKLEKRQEWAESRRRKADAAFKAASNIAGSIPLGQPILVGHHSEGKMRRLYGKIDSNMHKGVESADMARHHAGKAAGLQSQLDRSIFSDDPDAVERLEERIAELEAKQEKMKAANKVCRNKKTTVEEKVAGLRELFPGITDRRIQDILTPAYSFEKPGFPSYAMSNNNANINRLKKRIEDVKRRQARAEAADEAENGCIVMRPSPEHDWCRVVFAEKPDRSILDDLKAAGFRWCNGCWHGEFSGIPESVREIAEFSGAAAAETKEAGQ
jgi:phage shock protein A